MRLTGLFADLRKGIAAVETGRVEMKERTSPGYFRIVVNGRKFFLPRRFDTAAAEDGGIEIHYAPKCRKVLAAGKTDR